MFLNKISFSTIFRVFRMEKYLEINFLGSIPGMALCYSPDIFDENLSWSGNFQI